MSRLFKSGFVTLIGRPNVGKSTLMNHLIGQKIAITSDKPQTTRNRIKTVYTDERGQIVFLDTPGVHKSQTKLGDYMVHVTENTLREVDIVLWLIEPTTYIGPSERYIAEKLVSVRTPVLLVINKTDHVQPDAVLRCIDAYKELLPFAEIIPVSALKGTNTDRLLEVIFDYLDEGPMYFDEDTVTDQPMRQIAAELVREKALKNLSDEIPHGIAVVIEQMKERKNGMFDIDASIICERETHKRIIIGKQGSMLKKIGSAARYEIEALMDARVNLQLWVKVRKDWRDNELYLKNYGYGRDDE